MQKRVAIVTGGARGIGRAIAERLSRQARVVVADLDESKAKEAAAALQAQGAEAWGWALNVADYSAVEGFMQRVYKELGRLDILVNNAGIIRRGNLFSMQEADWDAVVAVNLKGTFNCAKHAAPYMKELGWGRIVNIASIAARLGDITSAPGYGASKAGVLNLTKTLARELAPFGITVNALAPHAIETEMSAEWSPETRQRVLAGIPLGRLGRAEEVAAAVAFLASEEAGFITGATLDINGGAWM